MIRFSAAILALALLAANVPSALASSWRVASADHDQTFAYGSETNRVWAERGRDRHLAVLLSFTNDPFVDRMNPRQYDNFTFTFPAVRLGKDGHIFYYRTPDGHTVPVAEKRRDFLGIDEIKLLPNAALIVNQPHGYLSLTLAVEAD